MRKKDKTKVKVKDWAREDRPREKFSDMGAESLSEIEIIATILGTGTRSRSVIEIAQEVFELAENSMANLAELPIKKLMKIHGVGEFKAIKLKAALELARRAQYEPVPENFKVRTSRDAYRVFAVHLSDLPHEEFWVLLLTTRKKLIFVRRVGQGGLSSTVADPRVIFKLALDEEADSIIVAHNHPSGSLDPSQADLDLTRRLVDGGKIIGVQVIDHLILAGKNYCSFADSGLL